MDWSCGEISLGFSLIMVRKFYWQGKILVDYGCLIRLITHLHEKRWKCGVVSTWIQLRYQLIWREITVCSINHTDALKDFRETFGNGTFTFYRFRRIHSWQKKIWGSLLFERQHTTHNIQQSRSLSFLGNSHELMLRFPFLPRRYDCSVREKWGHYGTVEFRTLFRKGWRDLFIFERSSLFLMQAGWILRTWKMHHCHRWGNRTTQRF